MLKNKSKRKESARERRLRKALERSSIALNDWLNTYASELCDEARVAEARKRIRDGGSTLAYIADIQEQNRKALGGRLITNGERLRNEAKS